MFKKTTNSYKFYWWYSILQLIKKESKPNFSIEKIAFQMILFAWYPVNYYKISLGKQDQIENYIKKIKASFNELNDDIKEEDLLLFLNSNKDNLVIKEIIAKLIKYVPYRFIRPWFEESIGVEDSKVNALISSLQHHQNKITPYTIDINKREIVLNTGWLEWIYLNIKMIESFTLFELFKYIEKHNPYVTNISLKLFKPEIRKLSQPTKLWKNFTISNGNEFKSVFENKLLITLDKTAIVHYLPWSLVTHDKLWNLHPIEQKVNSCKSNKIAEKKYLSDFTNLQFEFVHHISMVNPKYLEDYFTLFSVSKNELLDIPLQKFEEILSNKINIETDLANNLGYYTNWSYLVQD